MVWNPEQLLEIRNYMVNLMENKISIHQMNQEIEQKTGIQRCFSSEEQILSFNEALNANLNQVETNGFLKAENVQDLGDFQTPQDLANKITVHIKTQLDFQPTILFEPSCGFGSFIRSALKTFPSLKRIYAVEKQASYIQQLKLMLFEYLWNSKVKPKIFIFHADINDFTISEHLLNLDLKLSKVEEKILVLGNPPWVTNTALSQLHSTNLPAKSNFKHLKGLDSLTGSSNFDIAESIITHIVKDLSVVQNIVEIKIAMLCKQTVVRNIVRDNVHIQNPYRAMSFLEINAQKWFDVAVTAGLFIADIKNPPTNQCNFFPLQKNSTGDVFDHFATASIFTFGWYQKTFVSNIQKFEKSSHIEGKFPLEWRQGIKHDLTKVCNLKIQKGGQLTNGYGDIVSIEKEYRFPLVKSSDIKDLFPNKIRYQVIVTQHKIGQETKQLEENSPKLWKYLQKFEDKFDSRKSKIYQKSPKFAMFGVGDYTFLPYKVAISGFYAEPTFCLLFPKKKQPIIGDDTCYLLSFKKIRDCVYIWAILNQAQVISYLKSITFSSSKRPYTKRVLQRINLDYLFENTPYVVIEPLLNKIPKPMAIDLPKSLFSSKAFETWKIQQKKQWTIQYKEK